MRCVRKRLSGSAIGVACLICLTGCGASGAGLTPIDAYLNTQVAMPKVRPDGRLTTDPPPITQATVNGQPADSAQRVIYELWYYGQVGQPNIVSLFEPTVQQGIGLTWIVGALASARDYMLSTWPKIVQTVPSGDITTVDVLLFSKGSTPVSETFSLRSHGGRWLIAYDSFLAGSLQSYVESVKDEGKPKPTMAGVAAGEAAADNYRNTFVGTLQSVPPAKAATR
jgi:hypothetical protein